MRLLALSDLHLSHRFNRRALEEIPAHPDDWLILAGDITNGDLHLEWCFRLLNQRFRQLVWVPGNHELWTPPGKRNGLRGEALYRRLIEIAQSHGVLTPEDPYPVFPHADGDVLLVPLFLLYDYSFRPPGIPADRVIAWAREQNAVCSDEILLHPDPWPGRAAWCAARCAGAEARLATVPDLPTVLINHFPLEEEHAVLPRIPRFRPWCGTRRTRGWHIRHRARAVVYGHLHVRRTTWLDGVPFQEVSLGTPRQWDRSRGIGAYLREVILAPGR